MKNKFLLTTLGAAVLALAIYSCQEPSVRPSSSPVVSQNSVPALPIKYLGVSNAVAPENRLAACKAVKDVTYWLKPGERNWVKDTLYCLCGDIRVDSLHQLNIAAGTLIRGMKASAGSLTIERYATINAQGTDSNPIIFTSSQDINTRAPQDWGGVILLGNAQVNQPTVPIAIEGFPLKNSVPGAAGAPVYGRADSTRNAESSGTFKFVRIEFGGVPLPTVANSEKNGLTLGAVGRGTTIDHVQVSFGGDDGFEWFGGVVGAKYLISHRNLDDDFDTDFGFSGKVQFGVASRDPQLADISASNGFESDNDGSGNNFDPHTSAIFSNFTVIGPIQCPTTTFNSLFQDGLHLRRRTRLQVYNTVVTGWNRWQVFRADANVLPTLQANLAVAPNGHKNVNEFGALAGYWTGGGANAKDTVSSTACSTVTNSALIYRKSGLKDLAWNLTGVDFAPLSNSLGFTSPILATGINATTLGSFFTSNATTSGATTFFKGARRVADDNGWLLNGWVNWQPESLSYANDGQFN